MSAEGGYGGKIVSEHVSLEPEYYRKWIALRADALVRAELDTEKPGFIRLPGINTNGGIEQEAIEQHADLIYQIFARTNPTKIIAIGESGVPLGRGVHHAFTEYALETGKYVGYDEVRKLRDRDPNTPIYNPLTQGDIITAHSYTKGIDMHLVVPRVEPEERILLIDDVIAYGSVGVALIKDLIEKQGAEVVGFGSAMSKDFQGGIAECSKAAGGAPVWSAVRFSGLGVDHLSGEMRPILLGANKALKPVMIKPGTPKFDGLSRDIVLH